MRKKMSIIGFGKETYLLVNGIVVDHEIPLRNGVSLLPVTSEIDYKTAYNLIKSDIDYSIFVLSMSNMYAQIRIVGETEEKVAMYAWNAQWDCLLLGAIINNSVMFNLQCDTPIESVNASSVLNVTNYALRGIVGESKELTKENENWIKSHYQSAYSLLDNERFQTAVHCMSTYFWHSLPRVQLAIIWSGIESLFNVNTELSFRISLYIANFLFSNNITKAKEQFDRIKKIYGYRSAAVHGNSMKGNITDIISESALLLNRLIKKCAELNALPDVSELAFTSLEL